MRRPSPLTSTIIAGATVLVTGFQNCGRGFEAAPGSVLTSLSSFGPTSDAIVDPAPVDPAPTTTPMPVAVADNVVPVYVVQNHLFVTLTVCLPGTTQCTTVPNVQIDTASTGLRLIRSALTFAPMPLRDDSDREIAECTPFGGEDAWGPLAKVDVTFGKLNATNVPAHIIDSSYATTPSSCGTAFEAGVNGLLGIGWSPTEYGSTYYTCSGAACVALSNPTMLLDHPFSHLASDNNGYVIDLPKPGVNQARLDGQIVLGLSTRANNVPTNTQLMHLDQNWRGRATFAGQTYEAWFDTGQGDPDLPPENTGGIANCSDYYWLLCPTKPTTFTIDLFGGDGVPAGNWLMTVADPHANLGNVHDTVAGTWLAGRFLPGLPFFFGRRVYIVVNKAVSPLGIGPLIAY